VITSLAGFEVSAFAFPLLERFLGLEITMMAGFAGPESVITSLAVLVLAAPNPLADAPQSQRL